MITRVFYYRFGGWNPIYQPKLKEKVQKERALQNDMEGNGFTRCIHVLSKAMEGNGLLVVFMFYPKALEFILFSLDMFDLP